MEARQRESRQPSVYGFSLLWIPDSQKCEGSQAHERRCKLCSQLAVRCQRLLSMNSRRATDISTRCSQVAVRCERFLYASSKHATEISTRGIEAAILLPGTTRS